MRLSEFTCCGGPPLLVALLFAGLAIARSREQQAMADAGMPLEEVWDLARRKPTTGFWIAATLFLVLGLAMGTCAATYDPNSYHP